MSFQPQPVRGHLSRQQPSLALWRSHTYHTRQEVPAAMQRTQNVQHACTSVMLLVRHDDHAVVDRHSLRRVGLRAVRILTSGMEAARILCGRQALNDQLPFPDLVLCDEQLSDMSGLEFLDLVRSHPKLALFPVIMALNSQAPALRRKLEELAVSGLLIRPYSGDAFLNQLVRAAAMHPPCAQAAAWTAGEFETNAFDLTLARFSLAKKISEQSAGKWYREGLLCLKREQWDAAAMAFQQALKEQGDSGDAARGLSLALRKKQQEADSLPERGSKKSLSRDKADALREDLLRAAREPDRAKAFGRVLQALDGGEDDAAPPGHGEIGSLSAESSGGPDPAATDREHALPEIALLGEFPDAAGRGVIGRFPRLRDALNVAKVTMGLYKMGKK